MGPRDLTPVARAPVVSGNPLTGRTRRVTPRYAAESTTCPRTADPKCSGVFLREAAGPRYVMIEGTAASHEPRRPKRPSGA